MNNTQKWTESSIELFMNILTMNAMIVLAIMLSKFLKLNYLVFPIAGLLQKCLKKKKKERESFSNEIVKFLFSNI